MLGHRFSLGRAACFVWLVVGAPLLQGCAGPGLASEEQETRPDLFTLGNLEIASKERLWESAQGLWPDRMARGDAWGHTVYRTVWKHPDGDRLVCLQYPGGELFGTPYDVSVLDRDWNVLRTGDFTVGQDDTPFCIALARSSSKDVPEGQRNRWLLVGGFWSDGYGGHYVYDTALSRLKKGEGPMAFTDSPYGFYFDAPTWDDEEKQDSARGVFDYGSFELRWIEPGVNLLALSEPDPKNPGIYMLPRMVIEPRLAGLIASGDKRQVLQALALVQTYGVISAAERVRVVEALDGALKHKHDRVRLRAAEALLTLQGETACKTMAQMTSDNDQDVRAFATMALTLTRDPAYIDAIVEGCKGLSDHREDTVIVWALERWGDPALLPALIQFLGEPYRRSGEMFGSWWEQSVIAGDESYQEWGNAALQAQRVIRKITGVGFPFDVKRSMKAWDAVSDLPPAERTAKLKAKFPNGYQRGELLLNAERVEQGTRVTIKNPGDAEVWLSRWPSAVFVMEINDDGSNRSAGIDPATDTPEGMVAIPPQASIALTVPASDHVPSPNKIELRYSETGESQGVIAWRGTLEADVKQ